MAAGSKIGTSSNDENPSFEFQFSRFVELASHGPTDTQARKLFDSLLAAGKDSVKRFCFDHERELHAEKRLFIEFNNAVIRAHFESKGPESVLMLLPFCLQNARCPHRITWNSGNCRQCGQCLVGEILKLAAARNVPVKVAARAVFAPRIIREFKPELTIAAACEDELFEGILQASPFRCFGLRVCPVTEYCIDTTLDVATVADSLQYFLGGKERATR